MLAVIVLIGVATAAVAFSVTQGLAGARAAAASADLAAALRATRAQAIVHGQTRVFDLDTRANRWRNARGQTVTLPPDMRLSITSAREDAPDDTGRIRFFPDGSSTGGHIVVQRGQRQWHVDVAWLTGAVSVR
jgi:general secretion pathway protein H